MNAHNILYNILTLYNIWGNISDFLISKNISSSQYKIITEEQNDNQT